MNSEGYKSKAGATGGAESVRTNCGDDACFDRSTSNGGKFRFSIKAKNRQVIGTSQSYETEAARDNGISAIARAAADAKVVDLTA